MKLEPRRTPLYEEHLALSAKMIEFAGYLMPVWYEGPDQGIIKEHLSVREAVGIFDLSHMGEIFIQGNRAYEFLQFVLCNDLRKIGNYGAQYTLLPTEDGGVVDDLIIYQISPDSFFAVVNAVNIDNDFQWLLRWNEEGKFNVKIENRSYDLALIAVQGQKSEAVLQTAGFENVHCILPFTFRRVKLGEIQIYLSATGYTGERGFELICENDHAPKLWRLLLSAGKDFGIKPVGLGARDSLRLEAGLCLYGAELDRTTSVLEANLGWTVCFQKDFIGKDVLLEQKRNGVSRLLFGISLQRDAPTPRHNAEIYTKDGELVGRVTSGAFSPVLKKNIALCYLKPSLCKPGNEVEVLVRGKRLKATTLNHPFVKHRLYEP